MQRDMIRRRESKYAIFDAALLVLFIANIVGFGTDYARYGNIWPIYIYFAFDAIYLLLFVIGRFSLRTDLVMLIVVITLNLIEFPFIFYFYGVNGLVYLILGVISNLVFLKGRQRIVMSALTIIFDITVMVIAYLEPQTFIDVLSSDAGEIAARYKNIAADAAYIISAILSQFIVMVLINNQVKLEMENKDLNDAISNMSRRDPLTRTFNKSFMDSYIEGLIKDKRTFTAAIYKISAFDNLVSKYGEQYNEILLVALAELILRECADKAVVARYSKDCFVVVFIEQNEMMDLLSQMNLKIDSGAIANVSVTRAYEKCNADDTLDSFIERLGNKVKGFGGQSADSDLL
ncbi:MAG: GGDEF domain-containing protein [Acholeplasmatales bacterium]|nr:GGDEF domain-containing protein [Acholeplasmatales bacterium]